MPVTKVEFERSVHRGLGRAVLWLQRGEIVPDRDFLLYACTHNLAYDRQTEDNRALHLFDIIQATGEPSYYARAIEKALEEVGESDNWEEDERSIEQMFDLLDLLAKNDDLTARQSLYQLFAKFATHSGGSGADALVDMDGLDGYLFVVRHWILHPQEEEDCWYETSLLEDVEQRFGKDEAQAFLAQVAQTEPAVGVYLAGVREKQADEEARRKRRPKQHKPDSAEIRQTLLDFDKRFNRPQMWRWGERMSNADAERFGAELLAETDPKRLERYLHLFHKRAFPLDHAPLLALAQSADPAIAKTARAALAQIAAPEVRALALKLMDTDPQPWDGIGMLVTNFCTGDEQAVERVVGSCWDEDEMHWLTLDVLRLVEANPQPSFAGALMQIYEEGYCTMCRHGVLKLLADIGPLPPSVIEECHYDADKETRKVMQEARHGPA